MDIQAKVAARRKQLEIEQQEAARLERERIAAQKELEAEQRRTSLDQMAGQLSNERTKVVRDGDHLSIDGANGPEFDSSNFKGEATEDLLRYETRRMWTPGENWQVIGLIVAGICTIYIGVLGILLICIGLWRRQVVNKTHRHKLLDRYPDIFANVPRDETFMSALLGRED